MMNEIKCPHCGKVFEMDEANYNSIIKQVRDNEFSEELKQRIKEIEIAKDKDLKIKETETQNLFTDEINKKELLIKDLEHKLQEQNAQLKQQASVELSAKDKEIMNLKAQYVVQLNEKDKDITALKNNLEVQVLNNKDLAEKQELIIKQAVNEKETVISGLRTKLEMQEKDKALDEQQLKENYHEQLKLKDEQIKQLEDFRTKLNVKLVGESLEQHCEIEFNNKIRPFVPTACFAKDSDVVEGTKGDYIYREKDAAGTELLSIMFEMKNELADSVNKKTNEIFFKKLDEDRRKKGCEYAVLVSMLELENKLYDGIYQVYGYEKMFVVRPQFFLSIISLLRNTALSVASYKNKITEIEQQNIDVTNFERDLNDFKDKFGKNYKSASDHFQNAIKEIDKSIARMEAVKKALTTSENQLRLANNKLEDVSVKKLTKNNLTMKTKFQEAVPKEV